VTDGLWKQRTESSEQRAANREQRTANSEQRAASDDMSRSVGSTARRSIGVLDCATSNELLCLQHQLLHVCAH
jgi:hypothetical protein